LNRKAVLVGRDAIALPTSRPLPTLIARNDPRKGGLMRFIVLLFAALAVLAVAPPAGADMIQSKMTLKDKETRALMKVPAGVQQKVVIENTGPGGLVLSAGAVTLKPGESILTTYKADDAQPFTLQGAGGAPNVITVVNLYYLF
jgi:hypothetical protein